MKYVLIPVIVLVAIVAFAVITEPSRPVRPPCESGMWQEQFSTGGYENVCMPVHRPRHDPIPSFSYTLDV